jgi:hypothetical protein
VLTRLIAIHQDFLPFAHILQQGRRDGGHIKGKEFVGVKPLPFGGPVDGQDFALSGLAQPVVGELLAQGIDFGAGSHDGTLLNKKYPNIPIWFFLYRKSNALWQ